MQKITQSFFLMAELMKKSKFLCALLTLALVFSCSVPSDAVRVRRLTLSDLRDGAESIIVGVVLSSFTREANEGKMVWTDYTINVEETLKAPAALRTEIVSVAGGQLNGIDVGVIGVPHFEIGERYVLFLHPKKNYVAPTVGWGQGIFRIMELNTATGITEVLISYDGEPLEIQNGGLIRGQRVYIQDNQLMAVPDQRMGTIDSPKDPDPVVLDADGNEIEQPPQEEPEEQPLVSRPFATLDDLRMFIRGNLKETPPIE